MRGFERLVGWSGVRAFKASALGSIASVSQPSLFSSCGRGALQTVFSQNDLKVDLKATPNNWFQLLSLLNHSQRVLYWAVCHIQGELRINMLQLFWAQRLCSTSLLPQG